MRKLKRLRKKSKAKTRKLEALTFTYGAGVNSPSHGAGVNPLSHGAIELKRLKVEG
ncbi:uncharacterized protein G2W53_033838 [Senna tora]|uniref:Uncharacterized protein n=1 Tax=Senna tora TaxID=362788 RepID=A0A834T0V8_9FABA|nr:uncharacterized protein G2W53_033838 [Senna tora]